MNGVSNHRNPYILGKPIHEPDKFFGRESLFSFIKDNLIQNVKIILLHGQRRIGKSSVLKQICNFVQLDGFVFIEFDLQHKGQLSLSNILHDLARTIIEQIDPDGNNLQPPTEAELELDINLFSRFLLENVYQQIKHRKIVLLLDEFDVANNESSDINIVEQKGLFPHLKKLLKEQDKLFIIPVIGRYLNDLPNLRNLFKDAPYQEIGLLDDTSAKRMIANPAQGVLTYQPEAIQEIIQLSAGHPYFTQVICFTLFQQARTSDKWTVNRDDVKNISDEAIANSDAGLQGFWQVLTIPERIIISSVAEAQKIALAQGRRVPEEPLALLKINGKNQGELLLQAWERLIENRYLYEDGRKVKVELIRRWLLQCHPLQNEIQNLQTPENVNIENLIQNLTSVAIFLSQEGEKQQALQLYERALAINPNNFNIAVSLAEKYLTLENFEKSLELHRQLYEADFQNYKEGYLHALSGYGHHLIIQGEYTLAKKQYNQILEIEPNRKSAKERLSEIEAYEHTRSNTPSRKNPPQRRFQIPRGLTLVRILAVITVFGTVGYGTYQASSDCPPGKEKEFSLFCVADKSRISNGDRTLFPITPNTYRDQGIQAFKKVNYHAAVQLFRQAVAANRNDPEVLIYYNNALASDRGNPITLAAAVPANNNTNFAQEILRGVAQAQHQFNQKNGLNGRLLEIKIANDAGQPEQARQVAAELVKDQSILGVIGHYSSDSTKAALEEYNKIDIPIISPTSTSTKLQGKNFFRSLPDDAAGGKKLAEYAFNNLKLTKVVIFFNPDSPYSESMREEFVKTFERPGGKFVRKPLNLADTKLDMDAEVNKSIYRDEYKAEAAVLIPDALNTDVALKIAKVNQEVVDRSQSRNRAIPGLKLLGGDILYSDQTLTKGGNAVEGLIVVVPWFRGETSQATNFAQQAEKQWGGGVSWRTATSYDATQAFIQALSRNCDRTTVIEKLKNVNLSPNDTSGDPLKFNREGEREIDPILVQIKDGKWVKIQQ